MLFKKVKSIIKGIWMFPESEKEISDLNEKINFLLHELQKNMERHRWEDLGRSGINIMEETKDSFDYQWKNIPTGKSLPSDPQFIANIRSTICTYLGGMEEGWFKDKTVADVGCGLGRFTYGLLSLGAKVTAMDQSSHGLERVRDLCEPFKERLTIKQVDILDSSNPEFNKQYDLVWCYGVVHHTGNTYLAMHNVCKMVKPGGLVFMMIYGFPDNTIHFSELNNYDDLRFATRNMKNDEKVAFLRSRYPEELVHGYFDAISPQINDILSFGEIERFMIFEGFTNVTRTFKNDNIHFTAQKKELKQ